jgi:hypothetical protein
METLAWLVLILAIAVGVLIVVVSILERREDQDD